MSVRSVKKISNRGATVSDPLVDAAIRRYIKKTGDPWFDVGQRESTREVIAEYRSVLEDIASEVGLAEDLVEILNQIATYKKLDDDNSERP